MENLTELVSKAKEGDEAALSQLLRALESPIRAFFISRIGRRADVDDLVQNTLLRVHRGLKDLKDNARLKAFAMKGALYELQDFYRGRYTAKETLFDVHDAPEIEDSNSTAGASIDVERALSSLSDKAREIIELREYGYRYEEIAEMIGSTEAAIKMQVKRAFDRMRDALGLFLLWASGIVFLQK
ncbi:MAG: RNA polymerase sigma factor [Bacteroidetes bacterium]|nr:RNA polymerase sigma factor [Bacteroidota bacterium]